MSIESKYTYLLVNLGSIFVPFLFSCHPKLKFHETWKAFFPAVFITGAFFILWDIFFTNLGVWRFNESYTLGVSLLNLPIEEWLFFFCIPYACVFTWHCFKILLKIENAEKIKRMVTFVLLPIILFVGLISIGKFYTSVTFLITALFLICHFFGVFSSTDLGRFYVVYSILLIPFIITNGILTGSWIDEPVVIYNSDHILGYRILTIPIEDVIYGLFLILLNVTIFEAVLKRFENE